MSIARATPIAEKTSTEQPVVNQPDLMGQKYSLKPSSSIAEPRPSHASSGLLAPAMDSGSLCGMAGAASPKRERQPSSKAAEAPALAPRSPGSPAQHAPAARRRPARSKRAWKEGTYIGNGMWLMCYCSRHTRALEEMGASRAVVSMTTGQGLQDALSPQPKARQTPGRPQRMLAADSPEAAGIEGCPDGTS